MKEYPGITLLESQPGDFDRFAAAPVFEDMYIKYGDQIDGVWCANDDMAMGVIEACLNAGMTDVIVMGFDTNRWALRELQAGNWNYDGQCSPYQAQIISDMIQQLEAGEALNLESKKIITEERGFDATTITEEDIVNYGIGDDPGVIE